MLYSSYFSQLLNKGYIKIQEFMFTICIVIYWTVIYNMYTRLQLI